MLSRERALQTLAADRFDVVVIGGGITGAGVALDAASRGYTVALVEKADFSSGTSSRSSKLIHGGLRYLQRFDLGLVRESLLERRLMARLAPHLVTPMPFVVPAFNGSRPDRMLGIGLSMYDVMATRGFRERLGAGRRRDGGAPGDDGAGDWSPDRHRAISGEQVAQLVPALASRHPTGGYLFYDCQTDDSRLVLTVLGEAERFGAICANRSEAVALVEDHRRVAGVRVRDCATDAELIVRGEHVVNATGVWADRIGPRRPHPQDRAPTIVPSRGTHIVIDDAALGLRAGTILPAGEGRSLFALPWLGRTLIGTTDNTYDGSLDHVKPASADIDYLLEATNAFFATVLTADDLAGAYGGARPLISDGDGRRSVDISRKAELYETAGGLITITGGKLTTWRRMAKLTIDRIVERDGREAPCRTHQIPLGEPVDPAALPRVEGVPEQSYRALASRYGHAAHQVLEIASERGELAQPILAGLPDLLAEARYAAAAEQATTVGDVLLRRTRLGLLAGRELCGPDAEGPARVASALAAELGWGEQRRRIELERFREETRSEGIGLEWTGQ